MYTPQVFQPTSREAVITFIQKNNFGTLISLSANRPIATHLPFLVFEKEDKALVLQCHLAKANPQWKDLNDQEVLVIFSRPHAYVSSSWYESVNVPTWNYIAIHLYGRARKMTGDDFVLSLKNLVDNHEAERPNRFHLNDLSEIQLKRQLNAIIGLEINISEVQASFKLSQNRKAKDYENIIDQLSTSENLLEREIAWYMRQYPPPTPQ